MGPSCDKLDARFVSRHRFASDPRAGISTPRTFQLGHRPATLFSWILPIQTIRTIRAKISPAFQELPASAISSPDSARGYSAFIGITGSRGEIYSARRRATGNP